MIRLAIAYMSSQWKLVTTLIIIIGLSLALPITSIKVVARYQSELKSRSLNPPLLVGAQHHKIRSALGPSVQSSLNPKENPMSPSSSDIAASTIKKRWVRNSEGRWVAEQVYSPADHVNLGPMSHEKDS